MTPTERIATAHFMDFYSCGIHILAECRCSAPWRRRRVSQIDCPTCKPIGKAQPGLDKR